MLVFISMLSRRLSTSRPLLQAIRVRFIISLVSKDTYPIAESRTWGIGVLQAPTRKANTIPSKVILDTSFTLWYFIYRATTQTSVLIERSAAAARC
jgi:hypothetical protein